MTAFETATLWCAMQTTLLAGLGLVAARLLMRRTAGAAATTAAAAAATILAVTLLVPVRLPSFGGWRAADADDKGEASPSTAAVALAAPAAEMAQRNAGGVDPAELARQLWQRLRTSAALLPQVESRGRSAILLVAVCGAALGGLRLAASLRYVARLRRRSEPIADERLHAMFAALQNRVALRRPVELRESIAVACPAAIGWRRPAVLLPVDRAGWTDDQLRAALAHELAHVARGDFAWRATACAAAAVHFWHPLVHLLARRLAHVQELAADGMAATAMGDRAAYLRALSELSLRLDDSLRRRTAPLVLPTFSSGLARRIAMLRSKDGSAAEGRRSMLGAVAAAAIALVGVATTALRGAADETQTAPAAASAAELTLAEWPVDPVTFGENQGVLLIKPAKLARHEAFAPVFPVANEFCRELLAKGFPSAATADFRLEAIEYVAGEVRLTIKPRTGHTEDDKGEVTLGCEDFAIRFTANVDWQSWIEDHIEGAETVEENGLEFVRLPGLAAFGPATLLVAQRDSRTLVCSANVDRLRAMTTPKGERTFLFSTLLDVLEEMPAAALVEVRLGQLSEADRARAENADVSHDPWATALQSLLLNSQSVFLGFALHPESGASHVGATIGCPNGEAAESVRTTLESACAAARDYLAMLSLAKIETVYEDGGEEMVQVVGTADTQDQVVQYFRELTENCEFHVGETGSGMGIFQAQTQAPFPKSIMTMYVPATAAGVSGKDDAARR